MELAGLEPATSWVRSALVCEEQPLGIAGFAGTSEPPLDEVLSRYIRR
jgi:hypothetical protein